MKELENTNKARESKFKETFEKQNNDISQRQNQAEVLFQEYQGKLQEMNQREEEIEKQKRQLAEVEKSQVERDRDLK